MRESTYYKPLCEWLGREKGYFCGSQDTKWYIDTGFGGQRIDVAGIKNVGNNLVDQIETVAVEVRQGSRVTKRDMQDAHGYSNLVHRCYLATTARVQDDELSHARNLGIGIIEITGKDSFRELVEPKYHQPDEADLLKFLEGLWIGQCTLCKCYFHLWDSEVLGVKDRTRGQSYVYTTRIKQFNFFTDKARAYESPFNSGHKKKAPKELRVWRYLCMDCVSDLNNSLRKWLKRIPTAEKRGSAKKRGSSVQR